MLFFLLRESDYIVIYDFNYPYTKNIYLQDSISTDYHDQITLFIPNLEVHILIMRT